MLKLVRLPCNAHNSIYTILSLSLVDEKVYGIVSIKNLLLKLAEIKVDIARDLSPLTGLPGNYEIQQHLEKVLTFEEFSILYLRFRPI